MCASGTNLAEIGRGWPRLGSADCDHPEYRSRSSSGRTSRLQSGKAAAIGYAGSLSTSSFTAAAEAAKAVRSASVRVISMIRSMP